MSRWMLRSSIANLGRTPLKRHKDDTTWTSKVCKIMAFMAIIMCLGLLFYVLLGFR